MVKFLFYIFIYFIYLLFFLILFTYLFEIIMFYNKNTHTENVDKRLYSDTNGSKAGILGLFKWESLKKRRKIVMKRSEN